MLLGLSSRLLPITQQDVVVLWSSFTSSSRQHQQMMMMGCWNKLVGKLESPQLTLLQLTQAPTTHCLGAFLLLSRAEVD